jgi:hypothetical protein
VSERPSVGEVSGEFVTEKFDYDGGRQEYSPRFDPERFAAHEQFLVHDVRRWVATRFGEALPAARTAAFGVSASAEVALATGLRHADVFGAVLCASPGRAISRPWRCRRTYRVPIWSRARGSDPSWRTRPGGHRHSRARFHRCGLADRSGPQIAQDGEHSTVIGV